MHTHTRTLPSATFSLVWLLLMQSPFFLLQGATTTMEMWTRDEKPNLTWSHPWASAPGFIIPWLLFGIRALAPGWASMSITPAPGSLTHGSYTLPTVKGPVYTSFQQADDTFTLIVHLPLGVQATVSLPTLPFQATLRVSASAAIAAAAFSVLWNGQALTNFSVDYTSGYATVSPRVGAGKHTFVLSRYHPAKVHRQQVHQPTGSQQHKQQWPHDGQQPGPEQQQRERTEKPQKVAFASAAAGRPNKPHIIFLLGDEGKLS